MGARSFGEAVPVTVTDEGPGVIITLYRALKTAGISQRRIAAHTGQSQPEVADIIAGRRTVDSYRLLIRIAEGLAIPRERMGLGYGTGAYPGSVTVADPQEGVNEDVRRQRLTRLGSGCRARVAPAR